MDNNSQLNIKGKNILIIGNRSYKNMGDELILLWTVKLLLQQNKKIIISCYDPQWLQSFFSQFLDLSSITFIHEIPKGIRSTFQWLKEGWLKELKYFWITDTVILWWGEIITEENPSAYWYRLVGMWPFLLRKCFSFKRKTRSLYVMWWIQIPQSRWKKRLFTSLLNRVTHLYLRDFQAVEEIKNFWYLNTDFFMDTSYFSYERSNIKKEKEHEKYIIVNLNKNGEKFIDEVVQDVEKYVEKWYSVYYVPVAKGQNTYYNDIQYKEKLEQLFSGNSKKSLEIQVLDRESDFQYFIKMVKNAEIVISTRLHLFLVASFLGTMTKVYPYQRKILKMQEVINAIID